MTPSPDSLRAARAEVPRCGTLPGLQFIPSFICSGDFTCALHETIALMRDAAIRETAEKAVRVIESGDACNWFWTHEEHKLAIAAIRALSPRAGEEES